MMIFTTIHPPTERTIDITDEEYKLMKRRYNIHLSKTDLETYIKEIKKDLKSDEIRFLTNAIIFRYTAKELPIKDANVDTANDVRTVAIGRPNDDDEAR